VASIDYASLAEESEKGFKLIPETEYEVEISSATFGKSKQQKDQYKVTIIVASGPEKGVRVIDHWTFSPESPGAVGFFFGNFRAFGLDSDFFKSLPQDGTAEALVCRALVGRRAVAKIKHEDYNGEPRNKIASWRRAPDGPAAVVVPPIAPPGVPVIDTAAAGPDPVVAPPPPVPQAAPTSAAVPPPPPDLPPGI